MWGTLPSCLSELTSLTKMRVTLLGTSVPSPAPSVFPSSIAPTTVSLIDTAAPTQTQKRPASTMAPSSRPSQSPVLVTASPTRMEDLQPTSRSPVSVGGIVEGPPPVGQSRSRGRIIASSVIGVALIALWSALFVRSRRRQKRAESTEGNRLGIDGEGSHGVFAVPMPETTYVHTRNESDIPVAVAPDERKGPVNDESSRQSREASRSFPPTVRKVRFKLPDRPLSWSFSGESGDATSDSNGEGRDRASRDAKKSRALDAEGWAKWITSPATFFDPTRFCTAPDSHDGDDADSSVAPPSETSSCNSVSPLLPEDPKTNLHFCLATASRQQGVSVPLPDRGVLGIKDRAGIDADDVKILAGAKLCRDEIAASQLKESLNEWDGEKHHRPGLSARREGRRLHVDDEALLDMGLVEI